MNKNASPWIRTVFLNPPTLQDNTADSERLIACAGAAGPALEGGMTKMGMMAGPGVVDKISIDPQTCEFNMAYSDSKGR